MDPVSPLVLGIRPTMDKVRDYVVVTIDCLFNSSIPTIIKSKKEQMILHSPIVGTVVEGSGAATSAGIAKVAEHAIVSL